MLPREGVGGQLATGDGGAERGHGNGTAGIEERDRLLEGELVVVGPGGGVGLVEDAGEGVAGHLSFAVAKAAWTSYSWAMALTAAGLQLGRATR